MDIEVTRRTIIEIVAGTALAGGATIAGMRLASEPALAASGLGADDVTIESVDGRVEQLYIAPTVTVKWENYRGVRAVDVRFRAKGPNSNGTVIDWTRTELDQPKNSGEVSFDLERAAMLGKNDGPLDASSFHATEEGAKTENEVKVMMDVRISDENDNALATVTPAAVVTYTVTVTNQKSEISVTGKLNTGGQCLAKNDFPEGLWKDVDCEVPPGVL